MIVRTPTPAEIAMAELWDIWTKAPSEFSWSYEEKETCLIIEGQAEVTDHKGNHISFGKGDWVEFEQGLNCTWKIHKAIRKYYRFG